MFMHKGQLLFLPHGQKVSQGCGDAMSTEITTHTRGWNVENPSQKPQHSTHWWWEGRETTNCGANMCTKHRLVTASFHLTRLIMHKGQLLFLPHGQKVSQGCGDAMSTEITTHTRGWNVENPSQQPQHSDPQWAKKDFWRDTPPTTLPLTDLWRAICCLFPFPQEEQKLWSSTESMLKSHQRSSGIV